MGFCYICIWDRLMKENAIVQYFFAIWQTIQSIYSSALYPSMISASSIQVRSEQQQDSSRNNCLYPLWPLHTTSLPNVPWQAKRTLFQIQYDHFLLSHSDSLPPNCTTFNKGHAKTPSEYSFNYLKVVIMLVDYFWSM